MYNSIKQLLSEYTLASLLLLVTLILGLLSFHGIDLCDEGWYMTFYQQIFNAPETVEYNFVFWLTGIVGGVWYELFPKGGILSFRLLTVVIYLATISVAYKVLIQYLKKEHIVIGLLMVMLINDFGYVSFYYNQLSGFLALCIVYFTDKGLRKNRLLEIFIAGFITAINVFSRLPNATLFILILVFPLQYFINANASVKYIVKQITLFFIGAITGFIAVYIAMYSLGHLDIMKNALLGLVNKGANADSNHNLGHLLSVYKYEYTKLFKYSIKLLAFCFVMLFIFQFKKNNTLLKLLKYALGGLLFFYFIKTDGVYWLYCMGFIGVAFILFSKSIKREVKSIAFLSLLVAVFLPLGSDGGIHNAGYVTIWLIVPMFFYAIYKVEGLKPIVRNHTFIVSHSSYKALVFIIVSTFFVVRFYKISNEAYFDDGSRLEKTYSVNSDLAKGVYTTKERAEIINDILKAVNLYVNEGDYLLAYDNIPMINYLTNTKPYMGISWVWVYDSETFDSEIKQAEKAIAKRPVVVQQKFRTIGYFSEPMDDYMSETKEDGYIYKKGRVKAMNSFLKRNNYKVVWQNDYFNILKPTSSLK